MNGISGQTTINATNTTLWHRVGAGFQSVVAGIWRGSTIVAPRVNTTLGVRNNPILSTLATNGTNAALSFRAVIAGMNVEAMGATTATAQAISRTSTALVPFEEATTGIAGAATASAEVTASAGAVTATARAISRTSTALVPFEGVTTGMAGTAVGAEAVVAGAAAAEAAASAGTIAAETIVAETTGVAGSLLGKITALGKSAWALAAAHPVITATVVITAIAVSTLIIAYRRSQRRNVTVPQRGEVPQDDGPDDAP
ncbi:MAG: hypothetical protein LBS22_00975 [Puniceicoccales bacterium]|jgi:hypothetical protein|nr:hypothetical protein [Puniceicoccales bacterium]